MGFAFLFLSISVRGQVCSDTVRSLSYTSSSFQNSLYQSFPQSVSLPGGGHISLVNKLTGTPGSPIDSLLVFQTELSGAVTWSRIFNQTMPSYNCSFDHLVVLRNGNILLSGNVSYTDNQFHTPSACLLLLDAQGNLLWEKKLDDLYISACNEGNNGDILLAGSGVNGAQLQYSRLDANGNLLNSYNYISVGSLIQTIPAGIYLLNGRVYLAGVFMDYSILTGYTASFLMARLDYNTGQLLQTAAYHLHHEAPVCDSIRLSVDRFSMGPRGRFTLNCGIYNTVCPIDSWFFAQLDSNLRVIGSIDEFTPSTKNGYAINDYVANAPGNGQSIYCTTSTDGGGTSYYALIDSNNAILFQRKLPANDALALPVLNFPGFDMQTAATGLQKNGAYFQLINGSADFSSGITCLGEDTPYLSRRQLLATPMSTKWTLAVNTSSITSVTPVQKDFSIDTLTICRHVSVCDSIRIHGKQWHCVSEPDAGFTVFRNAACSKMIRWDIDASAGAVSARPNDTTISLHFSRAWKGYLYAKIEGCGLKDSLQLDIQTIGQSLSLGPDTVVCSGASVTLRPSGVYASYQWQDGSTDSLYLAKDTGTYYLTATDFCDVAHSDTVQIIPAQLKLAMGPQTEICNKDSLIVVLPASFSHFTWAPEANGYESDSTLILFPGNTATYYISAEKYPGCMLTDTLHVIVDDCRNILYFPNAFTPNGDGSNEIFKPHADGVLEQYELSVYNRWGQLIFTSREATSGWNGCFHGQMQPTGAFIWVCRYQFKGDRPRMKKGDILLIR